MKIEQIILSLKFFLFLSSALLCLVSCAVPQLPSAAWQDPSLDSVWPAPPDAPRIKLLRVVDGVKSLGDQGQSEKFFSWLTGEDGGGAPIVSPFSVATDGNGRIWLTDSGLQGVHLFDLARRNTKLLSSAGDKSFILPLGVAYCPLNDRVYVTDAVAANVYALRADGKKVTDWAPDVDFARPVGIAVGVDGKIYVVDTLKAQILVLDSTGAHISTLDSADSEYGPMNRPTVVSVDQSGRVFVVDSLGFRVLVFTERDGVIASIGRLGDAPGSLARPRGVAVDSEGHVYISDAAFDNIQIFDLTGNTLLFFGSAGSSPGFFSLPAGLTFDEDDRLYAVDAQNRRVQVFQYIHQP